LRLSEGLFEAEHQCASFKGNAVALRDDEGHWMGYRCKICGYEIVAIDGKAGLRADTAHLGMTSHLRAHRRQGEA
jgi:hypothetical protein